MKTLRYLLTFIDLKLNWHCGHTSEPHRKETAYYEFWKNYLCSAYGLFACLRISAVCRTIQRQLQDQEFYLFGSVPLYGICPTDLSGELTRYSGLFTSGQAKALSYGHPRQGLPQYSGQ